MEKEEKQKKPVGRPSLATHWTSLKVEGELWEVLEKQSNRNRYINDSIRQRMEKEGLIKKK